MRTKMKRHVCLAAILALTVGASLGLAQGRGQGAGSGGNNNNAGMPWEALRAGMLVKWDDVPRSQQKTEPFKIFDNVAYVGLETVGAYLITTSDGLILIDATYADSADHVLESVRKLGADPARIKYIIVTHGHNDHFAGAGRIKQATGARIAMSAEDWTLVERLFSGTGGDNGMPFTRDLVLKDDDTLKLGDTNLKFHVLPGHTPGNVGTEIQARDGRRTYRALVGLAFAPAPGLTEASIKTTERLKQLGPWDALLTSHPYLAPVPIPLTAREIFLGVAPAAVKKQTSHPAAAGAEYINAYFDTILTAVRERLAREKASSASRPTQ